MAGDDDEPNATRWAALFGISSALLAGLVQAVLSYYTVVGFEIDWITFHRNPIVETSVVALGTGLGVFLHALIAGTIAGANTWHLAGKGRVRGDPERTESEPVTSWSEFGFSRAAGVGIVVGVAAGTIGLLGAELSGQGGLDGQTFFVFQVVMAVLAALLSTVLVTRRMADACAAGRVQQENPRGNVISRIQLFSARNAIPVVVLTLLVVGATGYGVTKINTDVDVADLLPRGNGNTTAAQNISDEFKSSYTQQVTLQLRTNPERCERDAQRVLGEQRANQIDCTNITAEPYVRAMEELYQQALEDEENPIEYTIGINSFYKLINWTIEGGQDAPRSAFALPPVNEEMGGQEDPTGAAGESRYATVNRTVWTAIPDTVTPIIDPSFDQTASLYLVGPTYEGSSQNIGREMLDFRDEYVNSVEEGDTTWTIWGEDKEPLFTVDIPVANAHQSQLAEEDFKTLFPIIFGVVVLALYFGFRSFTAISIAGGTLLNAALITYGAMGHLEIPLNTLNLIVLPLILGNGIDYAIHQVTEFAHSKSEGLSDAEALKASGGRAGFAMFIATVTTISGLIVMMISPSLLMAQLGLLAAIAMGSVYLLVITWMPALLSLAPTSEGMGQDFKQSGITVSIARAVSKNRIAAVFLVALLTAGAYVGQQNLTVEEFGEPAQNFPEDDPLREEHETGLEGFYDLEEGEGLNTKTNIVVFEGNNENLQSHRYIEALQGEMSDKESLNLDTSRNLPFLIRTWLTVKDGPNGAIGQIARDEARQCSTDEVPDQLSGPLDQQECGVEQTDNYPQTEEEIETTIDEIFESPMATFASLFVNHPENDISVMTVATSTGDFEDAEAAWNDVWDSADAQQERQPHDLRTAFVGNTALNYLFITEELPWLTYLGIASGIVLLLLAAMFTKTFRATLAIGSVVGLTSVWWLGLLPAFDIGLAITLMLPAVFITSIGSDYAVHMTWSMIREGDHALSYGVVGKAILFSAITDIGAFAVFTQTQNVAASEAMLATVIAIALIFLVTMLILPILYPVEAQPAEEDAAEEVDEPARSHDKPPTPA
jgi:predicted RND superfamily exporter protein